MTRLITLVVSGITVQITGHAIWVLSLINLAWMLFKDVQLFSWWWVGASVIAFVAPLIVVFISMVFLQD